MNRTHSLSSIHAGRLYLRLLTYLKPYKSIFAVGIAGFLAFAASQPAFAELMKYLVAEIYSGNRDIRWTIPALLIAIFCFRGVGSFVGNYCFARVSFGIVDTLRKQLFNRLVHMPNDYFDNHNSGGLISRITYDVSQITDASTEVLKTLVREGATVAALLGYLFLQDWLLTSVFLLITPLLGAIVSIISRRLRRLSQRIQLSMGDMTHVCSEMINNYRVMRIFGGEAYEKKRFSESSHQNYRQHLKMVTTASIGTPVMQIVVALALGLLMFLALSYMDMSNPENFIAYLTAASLIPKPVRQITGIVNKIQKAIAAADSIFYQLDQPLEQNIGGHQAHRVTGKIVFDHVSFSYKNDDDKALQNLCFTVEPGQTVALVGRSGSGKTTLVNLLARFYPYQSGDILLDDVPLKHYELLSLRRQIALVNQSVTLFNDTVANNIAYGDMANIDREKIKTVALQAHAWEFIERLPQGLHTLIGEDGARLSGGQRQRLAIARALLKDAPILIFDEATSALDTESERHLQQAMEKVMKGRTTLVVAHRLSTIEHADKILVLDKGAIVEEGKHRQLLAQKGLYASLYAQGFAENT